VACRLQGGAEEGVASREPQSRRIASLSCCSYITAMSILRAKVHPAQISQSIRILAYIVIVIRITQRRKCGILVFSHALSNLGIKGLKRALLRMIRSHKTFISCHLHCCRKAENVAASTKLPPFFILLIVTRPESKTLH
jgi:hypothetical protein